MCKQIFKLGISWWIQKTHKFAQRTGHCLINLAFITYRVKQGNQ
ncbi:hypothetical protein CFter6_4244 [Collimonas fungivorans]|uniref:Uncharacterized protein n=1 Tax=Collimonas fungivorans TaxID=158899 RepID=A0A127PGK1_9BURK|nr:hypothetical protein CFter6_4244 [Collimonas fungivorans]